MKMIGFKQGELPLLPEAEMAEVDVLAMRQDSMIDCSDIPERDDGFMKRAVLWKDVTRSGPYNPVKISVNTKVDADVTETGTDPISHRV